MTGTSSSRRFQVALGVIAFGAFLLRVFPFFGPDGAWSYRVDYDEGVYFSSASLLLDGLFPYRDYVFVHPPGLLVFLSLTSWTRAFLGVDGAFALSRWIAALLGTINVLLVARLLLRWPLSWWAALCGAAFYATYPELVQVERGPFLEPLLNLVCLSLASAVVNASRNRRWVWVAGALAGAAVSIKLWAVIWVAGAVWGLSTFVTRREFLQFIGAAALSWAVIVLPFALQAPAAFVTQTGLFHAWRPPDGMTARLPRVEQILALRHLASPLFALLMLSFLVVRRGAALTVAARVVALAWLLTLAAFFSSPSYWAQYNAHLIASEAVLAGALLGTLAPRWRWGALAVVTLSLFSSIYQCVHRAAGDDRHLLLARSPLGTTPDCVFTFEPGWSLAAGRLPPRNAPMIVDSYAHQLLGAVQGGRRFASSQAAFASSDQPLSILEQCENVVLGERGHRQLSAAQLERLQTTHAQAKLSGFEVWQRRPISP
ncbi:MAG: hypothetical protein Q8K32_37160 [Archangium sp.]|nr:hypothetical protein [Archangium sp.]